MCIRDSSILPMMHDQLISPDSPAAKPQNRVDKRKIETRGKLLASARRLFAVQGFEQTTIRDIAGAADIALGGFYNYFSTKDDVLAALLEEAFAEQLRLLVLRQDQVDDVAERVSIAHRHLLAAVRADPDWGWLLVRSEVDHRIIYSALGQRAGADLEDGLKSGRFQVADPGVALRASGGALLGLVHSVLEGEFTPDDDSAHAEGILRTYGVAPEEAAEISRRELPPLPAD